LLFNVIPVKMASAVGAATLLAGAAFGVAAFADEAPAPEATVASAEAGDLHDAPFIDTEEPDEQKGEEQRAEAEEARTDAVNEATANASAQAEEKEEKQEASSDSGQGSGSGSSESAQSNSSGGSSGGSAPSGSPKEIAQAMLSDYGWGGDQWSCLEKLWEKESNWDHTAQNPSSGAYGIPQSLPGDKMASAGSDWRTNPATQIEWGLGYIDGRYGSPCGAWSHSQANNWY
jgi:hypothetical protein